VDDIIDVIVQEHTEDMLRLAGVRGQDLENRSVFKSVQRRLPWLMINLGTAILAAFTVTLFESVIAQVVALASSMSIVTGMGGNAGNQSLSVVVRGIALGELDFKKSWPLVFREMLVGITQGAIIGVLAGIILYMKVGNIMFGVIIFMAMVMNMLIATSFGFLIPLIIKRFNFDPALGSSIFLTASTDIFGFFIFLSLAKLFLPYLT
jgi:magnesium transporter